MNKVEFLATKFLKECAEMGITLRELQQTAETMEEECRQQRRRLRKDVNSEIFEMPKGDIKAYQSPWGYND